MKNIRNVFTLTVVASIIAGCVTSPKPKETIKPVESTIPLATVKMLDDIRNDNKSAVEKQDKFQNDVRPMLEKIVIAVNAQADRIVKVESEVVDIKRPPKVYHHAADYLVGFSTYIRFHQGEEHGWEIKKGTETRTIYDPKAD